MPRSRPKLIAFAVIAAVLLLDIMLVLAHLYHPAPPVPGLPSAAAIPGVPNTSDAASSNTTVWAHNLRLRKRVELPHLHPLGPRRDAPHQPRRPLI